jgi:hypothetical protein
MAQVMAIDFAILSIATLRHCARLTTRCFQDTEMALKSVEVRGQMFHHATSYDMELNRIHSMTITTNVFAEEILKVQSAKPRIQAPRLSLSSLKRPA